MKEYKLNITRTENMNKLKNHCILGCNLSDQLDSTGIYLVNGFKNPNLVNVIQLTDELKLYGDKEMCYKLKNEVESKNLGFKCNVACNELGDWSIYFEKLIKEENNERD